MKTTLKNIALGTLVFLLFSQMSFKNSEFIGFYKIDVVNVNGNVQKSFLLKNRDKLVFEEYLIGTDLVFKYKGKWRVEDEMVILNYKKKFDKKPDTLAIKRNGNKIESLGNYKKLKTDD